MTRIKDMKIGNSYEGIYILASYEEAQKKNGSPYIKGVLIDSTGEINFNMWDIQPTLFSIEPGMPAKVIGDAGEFQGSKQLNMKGIWPVDISVIDTDPGIVPTAPIPVKQMEQELKEMIDAIEDPDYRSVVQKIIFDHDFYPDFIKVAAAKSMHHDVVHGLLMHTLSVAKVALSIASCYSEEFIDKSLLCAGAILHDVGKLKEFQFSRFGLVPEYSMIGNLQGHLFRGAHLIDNVCAQLNIPAEKRLLLVHLIASHHGKKEYGAIREPMCVEAMILSHADIIDADEYKYEQAMLKGDAGELYKFNGSSMYVPERFSKE